MDSKQALGRGLGAIFEEVTEAYEGELPSSYGAIEVDIDSIRPNPYQPRKQFDKKSLEELSSSIVEHGLLQPIVVVEDLDGYMLIAGERRLRASKMAGFSQIKTIIADVDIEKLRELALIENIQREDLNPIELAFSYHELLEEHGITHDELATMVHKSRAQITNTIRLLTLSEPAKIAITEGKMSQGHAKALIGLEENHQNMLIDSILGQKLSVREVEATVKKLKSKSRPLSSLKKGVTKELDLSKVERLFSQSVQKIHTSRNKITLEFSSSDEIESFLTKISITK